MTTLTSRYLVLFIGVGAMLLIGLPGKALSQDTTFPKRRPTVCTEQYLPVCGRIGRVTKTYSNACFAHAAGAKVIAQGPCRTGPRAPAPN